MELMIFILSLHVVDTTTIKTFLLANRFKHENNRITLFICTLNEFAKLSRIKATKRVEKNHEKEKKSKISFLINKKLKRHANGRWKGKKKVSLRWKYFLNRNTITGGKLKSNHLCIGSQWKELGHYFYEYEYITSIRKKWESGGEKQFNFRRFIRIPWIVMEMQFDNDVFLRGILT